MAVKRGHVFRPPPPIKRRPITLRAMATMTVAGAAPVGVKRNFGTVIS